MFSFGIRSFIRNTLSKVEKSPILIFGFPKSGTSAIASLLAERTGLSATIDTRYLWQPYLTQIKHGEIDLCQHINKYTYPFSKKIIKEPSMCFIIDEVLGCWENPSVVRIYRNKTDTIRSILQRLNIPGNLRTNPPQEKVHPNWRWLLLDDNEHYVSVLSKKYDECMSNMDLLSCLNPVDITYESFRKDKESSIDFLAEKLLADKKFPISHLLNKQFQPQGDSTVNIADFFQDNLPLLLK